MTGHSTVIQRGARAQHGQTIIIAVLVLLLLAFLGGLFATIVTRNLQNAGRANQVHDADYYAEAGIRFANDQLTYSTDGADWRPPLQYALGTGDTPANATELARYNAAVAAQKLAVAPTADPDKAYLDQGFSRYDIGGGRYLLRVTYDPIGIENADNASAGSAYSTPLGRYIKIESIGREGVVDPTDPTTYRGVGTQLNATLVQYKTIGITDYARFITNPDKRSDIMALGVASQMYTDTGGDSDPDTIATPGAYDFDGSQSTANDLREYPVITTYGAPDAYMTSGGQLVPNLTPGTDSTSSTYMPGGGAIHVNGSARFYGLNYMYLNSTTTGNETSGQFGESAEIAGNLLLDNFQPGAAATSTTNDLMSGQDAALILLDTQQYVQDAPAQIPASQYVAPSNDTGDGFSTHNGAVRDGSGSSDSSGQPRSINRIEPPVMDSVNPVTNLPRYKDITANSANRAGVATPTGGAASPAAYGYGQAIYVDNFNDVQRESSSLVGGYTLIDEWLHRNGAGDQPGAKGGWVGSFYRPPGVDITLGRQQITQTGGNGSTTKTAYGVRLTRTDVDGAGNLIGFKDTNGNAIAGVAADGSTTQSTMTVSYDSMNASNAPTAVPSATNAALYAAYQANPNNDVIIYAEENVRVHGVVSASSNEASADYTDAKGPDNQYSPGTDDQYPRHVTIVTDGTAYIDGSLLRGNPDSTIQVIAHDYVCVNTTQFLAGPTVDQNPAGTSQPAAFVGDPNIHALDFSASDEVLVQEFNVPAAETNPHLYVSGGPSAPGAVSTDFDIVDPTTGYSLGTTNPPFAIDSTNQQYTPGTPPTADVVPFYASFNTTGLNQPGFFNSQTGLTRTTFNLQGTLGTPPQSQVFDLAMRRDPGQDSTNGGSLPISTQDFLLERAAVLPMDIRIEAGLFAQTRSFFVIPGDWFNSDTADNLSTYGSGTIRPNLTGFNSADQNYQTEEQDANRFPFYGQPIDMKITIDGSVSEAVPADISAQTAWMLKWGWIPQFHGGLVTSTTPGDVSEPAGHTSPLANHPDFGLQIIYNPLAGYPYAFNATMPAQSSYLRTDQYGRPLPFAPKLPVSVGLLYTGQNTGESVLQ